MFGLLCVLSCLVSQSRAASLNHFNANGGVKSHLTTKKPPANATRFDDVVHKSSDPPPNLQEHENPGPGNATSDQLSRARRQTTESCPLPPDFPELITELGAYLNTTALLTKEDDHMNWEVNVSYVEKDNCPKPRGDWWPMDQPNLRTICPWRYEIIDLGELYYPRRLLTSHCLCMNCLQANSFNCAAIRAKVTVIKRDGCKHGLAVMRKEHRWIATGCHCQAHALQSGGVHGSLITP
ncbi:uncharacterized protein LOC131940247 [Physella acuta]|uniref:uncharacterized protein LOC131940247 n=1 Tax=Physella acuta TaxID=109671 RepID=UPI0027DB9684|nr:uncharacterized protein LOC131940247 [Physella acuta]